MQYIRIAQAADLLGVSDDTVRRWIDRGDLSAVHGVEGHLAVDGRELAEFARARSEPPADPTGVARSARNRLTGLVTKVTSDTVMSQVEMQCGRFRVVSLLSTEAVRELALEPGSLAVAVVKATNVIIERPNEER